MEQFTHKVSAIYHDEASARQAGEKLCQGGFPERQLRLVGPHDPSAEVKLEPEGGEMAKEVVKDIAIGSGVGGALGIAGSAAMGTAGMALFLTQPVLATLMIAGYAAGVGGLLGFLKGIKVKESVFLGAAEDALQQGYWVLVAHGKDEDEEKLAHELIAETMADKQIST